MGASMREFPADRLDSAAQLAMALRGTLKVLEMAIACESGGLDPEQRGGLESVIGDAASLARDLFKEIDHALIERRMARD